MKKHLLLLLFVYNLSIGQNWAPIVSSHVYNYFSSAAFSSATIIRTDSSSYAGTDSVFYLNRIIKPVNSTKYLNNQGQFLKKQVISSANGYVTFKGDSSFTLKPIAGIADSWVYDSIQNLIATVISLKEDSVLGNLDSIKIIAVSNLDTIVLSKNYGITYFKKQSINIAYTLKGIQNLGLGYKVPMFSEIFNFDIGDIFEYRKIYSHSTMSVANTFTNFYHYKLIILSKNISGSTISYSARKLSSDTIWTGFGNPYNIVQKDTIINISYTDSVKHVSNLINNSVTAGGHCTYGYNPYFYKTSFDDNNTFNCHTKTLSDKLFIPNSNNDTLDTSLNDNFICRTIKVCGENFGIIYSYDNVTITGNGNVTTCNLIGSIKSGMQYGTITNYIISAIGIPEHEFGESIKVFPTVFSGDLNIAAKNKTSVTISDLLGRILYSHVLNSSDGITNQLNLDFLQNGNYFITFTNSDNRSITKKIIKVN